MNSHYNIYQTTFMNLLNLWITCTMIINRVLKANTANLHCVHMCKIFSSEMKIFFILFMLDIVRICVPNMVDLG